MEDMEMGFESAAEEMVEPRWGVGPTEDMVLALMETFVDPLLPLRVSHRSPSEKVQIAIAKQMHTVVLLYNYHHRKQNSELAFLEFMDFCKLAIAIRPPLIAFMKLMTGTTLQELNGTEDQLSVTEKAIKDACNIAIGLDASRDVPNLLGWPISKVAVLLVDSKKENCMLQSNAVIEGARSLIEKELNDSSSTTLDRSGRDKVRNKRKRGNQKAQTCSTDFLQLAYDVVKDVTGIRRSNLKVLETHTTYSLSKEKSATRFYIMKTSGLFDEHNHVSLKFLVDSVQGSLAEKLANGSWKTTPHAKFYRMLPCVELILRWLSGCETDTDFSDQKNSPADILESTEKDGNLRSNSAQRFDTLDSAASNENGILEKLADGSEQADKRLLSSPLGGPTEAMMEVENEGLLGKTVKDDKMPNANLKVYHHRRKKNNVTQLKEDVPALKVDVVDALESNHTQLKDEKVSGDEDCLLKTCRQTGTVSIADQRAQLEAETEHNTEVQSAAYSLMLNPTESKDENASGEEGYLTNSCEDVSEDEGYLTTSSENVSEDESYFTNSCENVSEDEGYLTNSSNHSGSASKENLQAQLEAEIKQNQNGTASTENLQAQPNAETKQNVEEQKSMDSFRSDHKKLSGDKAGRTKECNHISIAFTETRSQLAQVEAKSKRDLEEITISGPDQLQNALALLNRKRRDVYSQICNMEDALALCEDIVARIRDGGEVDLARKCIQSIIGGNFQSLLEKNNHQDENRISEHRNPALSGAYLVGKSSCQDLEYTCLRNNWGLPRYLTLSQNGKFQSNVVVEGKDFKLHAEGGFKSHPSEARETAAAQMITVMHTTFS